MSAEGALVSAEHLGHHDGATGLRQMQVAAAEANLAVAARAPSRCQPATVT
jgi:hypothetical protein